MSSVTAEAFVNLFVVIKICLKFFQGFSSVYQFSVSSEFTTDFLMQLRKIEKNAFK